MPHLPAFDPGRRSATWTVHAPLPAVRAIVSAHGVRGNRLEARRVRARPEPLDFPWLADAFGRTLPGSNLVVSAAILLISLPSRRRVTGFLALVGSLLALFGPRWGLAIPALVERIDANAQARVLGILIMVLGWFWPRRKSS